MTGRAAMPLHTKMAIGFLTGIVLGLIVHVTAGGDAAWVQWLTTWITVPIGQLFLRLLFMLVIPLLFSALVVGVAEMGDVRSLVALVGDARLHGPRVVDRGRDRLVLVNFFRPVTASTRPSRKPS